MGKGGQELSDPASSRPGPKRRAERLSQLSLAQFLFLLVPVSLPGAALPSVEEQPRWCSYPSSTPCCERPLAGPLPPPPLRAVSAPMAVPPPLPSAVGALPGSAHTCNDSLESSFGVKVHRTMSIPIGTAIL